MKLSERQFLNKLVLLITLMTSVILGVNAQVTDLTGYYIDSTSLNYYCYLKLNSNYTFEFQASDTSTNYVFHGSWNTQKNKLYLFDKKGRSYSAKIRHKNSKIILLNVDKKFKLIKTDRILPIQKESIDSKWFPEPVRKIWCDSLTNAEKEKVVTDIEQFKHDLLSYDPLKDSSFVSYIASLPKEGLLFSLGLNEGCICTEITTLTLIYFLQAYLATIYGVEIITTYYGYDFQKLTLTSVFSNEYRKMNIKLSNDIIVPEDVYNWVKNDSYYSTLPEIQLILQKIEHKES